MTAQKPQIKTAPKPQQVEEKKEGPNKSYRLGNINIAEWHKTNAEGVEFENFTANRCYTDKDNKWHNTATFGYNDLLKLRNLLDVIIFEKTSNAIVRRGADYDEDDSEGIGDDIYERDTKVYKN